MKIFLDDNSCKGDLVPFSLTRHVSEIRIGILTIKEKWERLTGNEVITDEKDIDGPVVTIPANIIPTYKTVSNLLETVMNNSLVTESDSIKIISRPWQIAQYNDWAMRHDVVLLTIGRQSATLSSSNSSINTKDIFIEEGAKVEHSILNASAGPIYIAKNAEVMEGCMIRGPFALGEHSVVKMGARIYQGTSIGPHCVAGGEIKNSILFGYSNKAHDGYLGDSVIGEWCNLGAGTSNSNVKNSAGEVSYILHKAGHPMPAGVKAGLLMGDYSRSAINTSFNTGTVVGVCCNIFGNVFLQKHIANFSWGTERYIFEKAIADINNWKKLKQQEISGNEIALLHNLYHSKS